MPKLFLSGLLAALTLMGSCSRPLPPTASVVHYRIPGLPLSDEFDGVMKSRSVAVPLQEFAELRTQEGNATPGLGLAVVTASGGERVIGRWRGFGDSAEIADWLRKRASEQEILTSGLRQVWGGSARRADALSLAHRFVLAGAIAEARKTLVRAKELQEPAGTEGWSAPGWTEFVEAEILLAEGEVANARETWNRSQQLGNVQRSQRWKFEQNLLLAERAPSQAAGLLESVLADPLVVDQGNRSEILFRLGSALHAAGQDHKALDVLDALAKESPKCLWGIKAKHEAAHLREEPHGHSH